MTVRGGSKLDADAGSIFNADLHSYMFTDCFGLLDISER